MKIGFLSFLVLFTCFSCNSSSPGKEVLEEGKMVSILFDIQLAEGKVSSLPITYDSSQVLYSLLEKDIFSKHGVSDSSFISSMEIYLEDAEKMDRIYARVIDSLVVLENTSTTKE